MRHQRCRGSPIILGSSQTIAGNASFTAQRDLIIRASLTTTSGGNLPLSAGTGGTGVGAGGVWVDHSGQPRSCSK